MLQEHPFAARDDALFLTEMNAITRWHLEACPEYRRVWSTWSEAESVAQLPFLHVGVFKHILFRTNQSEVEHERTLLSSSTTGGKPSRIVLDARSSALQSQSSLAILKSLVGHQQRPLLVLDDVNSLRRRGEVSARVAAAMSLRPLASEIHFLLAQANEPASIKWDAVRDIAASHDALLIYGFSWILWMAWGEQRIPADTLATLRGKRVHFVHSGGWKRLESLKVDRERFDASLLEELSPDSRVVDFYGLVEQIGILYPLCEHGFRHVPRWAQVLVRDPWTLEPIVGRTGQLQLMNPLAFGAPYHNVLTEDLGRVIENDCPCGRQGTRFELLGRIPKAEVRGCANV